MWGETPPRSGGPTRPSLRMTCTGGTCEKSGRGMERVFLYADVPPHPGSFSILLRDGRLCRRLGNFSRAGSFLCVRRARPTGIRAESLVAILEYSWFQLSPRP